MARVLAIDYGQKRTGLAVTDPLQIISTALETVETKGLIDYLKAYVLKEPIELFVIGLPKTLANQDSDNAKNVRRFAEVLQKEVPTVPQFFADERFTSSIAKQTMIDGGMKKKDRRDKANVDKISATLILQAYMESRR